MPNELLDQVRRNAFLRLTLKQKDTTNLHLDERIYEKGATIGPRGQAILAERPTVLVFADDNPRANFAHPCRYLLYDAENGQLYREVPANFPPFETAKPATLHAFHEPVQFLVAHKLFRARRSLLHAILVPGYQRFAIMFSGMSNQRHLNDMEFLYRTLIDQYGFSVSNIQVLSYDGTLNTQDGVQSQWPGDNTSYRIKINGPGTKAALAVAIDNIKGRLKKDDLLLIHTNNHGGYDNTPGTAYLCTYPSWSGYYAKDFANKLGELPRFGKLIVMMEQCHSGGFNNFILSKSTAAATSVTAACIEPNLSYVSDDGNWDPFARDWIAAQAWHDAFGGPLAHSADADGDGAIQAKEAFSYANLIKDLRDTPNFNQSSEAGGDIVLGPQSKSPTGIWPNGKTYFFRGPEYDRYDPTLDQVDSGYPMPIAGNWPGFPATFAAGIDAWVLWTNGKAFFFRGNQYIRYDVASDQVDSGYPMPITGNWPGLWGDNIDAGVVWPNGKAFFFKASQYTRYDIAMDQVDAGYPQPIAGNWTGFPASFAAGVDAAVVWNNGKAYFFKGSDYIRYDIATDQTDANYPKPIKDNWPGLWKTGLSA